MSSSSPSSTATTLVAAIVTGTVMSATVSIFMKIGWSKTPPSVKTVIVDKGRNIKRSLSSSSESLKDQIRKRMSSLSPRNYRRGSNSHCHGDDEDEDENSDYYGSDWYGRSSSNSTNNNRTLNDHEMIVFKSLQTIFDLVAAGYYQDGGEQNIRPSAAGSTTTNKDRTNDDKNRSIFLPGPRLYLSLMTLLRSRNVINKLHPPENSFVDNWDDDDEHERVNQLLDFCIWAESSIVQNSHTVEENDENVVPKASNHSRSGRTTKFFQDDNRRDGPGITNRNRGTNVLNLPAALKAIGFKLLSKRMSSNDRPGLIIRGDNWSFGYFLAVHHGRKEIVISIGTRSKSNKFPASVSRTVVEQQQQQPQNQKDGQTSQTRHRSLYETVSRVVADDIGHLIDNFFSPLQYDLYIVGHSVSAGVACQLGMLLKTTRPSTRLQVYAFGPPPCLYDQYQSPRDFITSVVNNNDCIPRINMLNLKHMMTLLERIDSKLKRWTLRSENMRSAKKHRTEMEKLGAQVFLSAKDLNDFVHLDTHKDLEDCSSTVAGIPGRVIFLWNHTQDTSIIGATVCNSSSHFFPSKQMPSTLDSTASTKQQKNLVHEKFMVDPTIFYDHTLIAYKSNIELLIEQKANTI
eukprot:CAMPEP_0113484954 /NCGR_PEP_ID=MMETSP0014_2-20120614/24232_1 /TAXON_ID=2857 /ORGANISM="Nitzschia sp." /LENGTH=628 /DNA_ID=CAMNT_0000378581 /DNA_START=226 /DNA_END=2112 /DNA_ORIENTATION=- /assembly_acc=CAM_ASM_000159